MTFSSLLTLNTRRLSSLGLMTALLGPLSCGDGDSNEIVIATVTRCTESRAPIAAPDLSFKGRRKEFFSKHPLALLRNQGGRTLQSPRIVAVFLGEDKMQRATEALLQSYGCTAYWRDAVNEYGIGDALYERTVAIPALPQPVLDVDFLGFEDWIRDGVAKNVFGNISEEHVLLFFLPPNARLLPDDCLGRLGGHSSIVTKDKKSIAYAYFDTCSTSTGPAELAERAHTVTHELIEIATDPDPLTAPAWNTLGPGILAPSLRRSTSAVDTEGADYCNDKWADAPDYPFAVARNYSNRLARAGRDPCDPAAPMLPIAALQQDVEGEQQPSIDLSSGSANVVLDIFAEDPSAALRLSADAIISPTGSRFSLLSDPILTHDADTVSMDLQLALPWFIAEEVAQTPRSEVVFGLCPESSSDQGSDPVCSESRILISALPPAQEPPPMGKYGASEQDAGEQDAGSD